MKPATETIAELIVPRARMGMNWMLLTIALISMNVQKGLMNAKMALVLTQMGRTVVNVAMELLVFYAMKPKIPSQSRSMQVG